MVLDSVWIGGDGTPWLNFKNSSRQTDKVRIPASDEIAPLKFYYIDIDYTPWLITYDVIILH